METINIESGTADRIIKKADCPAIAKILSCRILLVIGSNLPIKFLTESICFFIFIAVPPFA